MKSLFYLSSIISLTCFATNIRSGEKLVTILATNDIHGALESTTNKQGRPVGGMSFWAGVVKSIRTGLSSKYGDASQVILLDGGDQFQGTLLSNYNEGQLMFKAMNQLQYDAAILGNHDYDFGPIGWLDDEGQTPDKYREALGVLVGLKTFPLLSSNTYLKSSIKSSKGASIDVDSIGCKTSNGEAIDWSQAQSLDFLTNKFVKSSGKDGSPRIAVIGIDFARTPEVTTEKNVNDLCFGDEMEHYLRTRKALDGQADIFVLLIHDGDTNRSDAITKLVMGINASAANLGLQGKPVDAVISGHTHFIYSKKVDGIPVIQAGSSLTHFGRIDLAWNPSSQSVTYVKASVAELQQDGCDKFASDYCTVSGGVPAYEGVPVVSDSVIDGLIADEKTKIGNLPNLHLGDATAEVKKDRINENALGDVFTDTFRSISGTEVAFLNMGGLREPVPAGEFTYSKLFEVIPFNNHGYVLNKMNSADIVSLLQHTIKTCGAWGALVSSGLKITFDRHCTKAEIDDNAKLMHVETTDGRVLYDDSSGVKDMQLTVATLDFLAKGGEGFTELTKPGMQSDLGILREKMKNFLQASPARWDGQIDGRYKNVSPDPGDLLKSFIPLW